MKLLNAVRDWLSNHKKITAAALGLVASCIPDSILSADQKQHVIEVLLVYLGAQGIADHGKERAKIEVGQFRVSQGLGAPPTS